MMWRILVTGLVDLLAETLVFAILAGAVVCAVYALWRWLHE